MSLFPGGSQTLSKSPTRFTQSPDVPLFASGGQGCYLYSGSRTYLDLSMALGACILGYAHPEVNNVVKGVINEGVSFTLPSCWESIAGEALLRYLPWADQVRFAKSGSDVTTAAVRAARTYTGRETILTSGYHGWHDWSICRTSPALGVPRHTQLSVVTLEFLEDYHLQGHEAGVIVEIAPGAYTHEDELGWLRQLREECSRVGAVLIFDEVLSGFRNRMGLTYPVIPDLACFGKAIGNGFSISALVGSREVMSTLDPGRAFFSGTGFGETTGLAAMVATLDILDREHVHRDLNRYGLNLRDMLRDSGADFIGDGSRLKFRYSDPLTLYLDKIQQEMAKLGVLFTGHINLSQAHLTNCDPNRLVRDFGQVIQNLPNVTLEGPPSQVPYRVQ